MTMHNELFTEPEVAAIWDRFFNRISAICRPLPNHHRQEIMLELQDHLFESFAFAKFGRADEGVSRFFIEQSEAQMKPDGRLFGSLSAPMSPFHSGDGFEDRAINKAECFEEIRRDLRARPGLAKVL